MMQFWLHYVLYLIYFQNLMQGDRLDMNTQFKTALHNYNLTFSSTYNARTKETKMTPLYKLKQKPRLYHFSMLDDIV